jgi:hypothetical protein
MDPPVGTLFHARLHMEASIFVKSDFNPMVQKGVTD